MKRRRFVQRSFNSLVFLPFLNQYLITGHTHFYSDDKGYFFVRIDLSNLINDLVLFSKNSRQIYQSNRLMIGAKSLLIQKEVGKINTQEFSYHLKDLFNNENYQVTAQDLELIHKREFDGKSTYDRINITNTDAWEIMGGIGVAATAVGIILGGAALLVPTAAYAATISTIALGTSIFAAVTGVPDYLVGNSRKNLSIQKNQSACLIYNLKNNANLFDNPKYVFNLGELTGYTFLPEDVEETTNENKSKENKNKIASERIEDENIKKLISKIENGIISEKELKEILIEYINLNSEETKKLFANHYNYQLSDTNRKEYYKNKQEENHDKGLLYSSVGRALNVVAFEILGEREARVFNVLVNYCVQSFIQGSTLGPYGWAAITLDMGLTLFSHKGESFEEIILKVIANIQKQLNFIIEKLYILEKNQTRIFEGLEKVYQLLEETNGVLTEGIEEIILNQQEILTQMRLNREFSERKSYHEANNRLKLVLKDGFELDNNTVNLEIVKLQEFMMHTLKQPVFTNYTDKQLSSQELKKRMFYYGENNLNRKSVFSLYDHIGLIPFAHNYDPKTDLTFANFQFPNLYEVNFAVNDILNWFMYGKIKKKNQKIILNNIKPFLENLRTKANEYARPKKIKELLKDYIGFNTVLLGRLNQLFINHQNLFFNSKNIRIGVFLSSDDSFIKNKKEQMKLSEFFNSTIDSYARARQNKEYMTFRNYLKKGKLYYNDFVQSQFIKNPNPTPGHPIIPSVQIKGAYVQPSHDWEIFDALFELGIFSENYAIPLNGDYSNNYNMYRIRVKGVFLNYPVDFELYYRYDKSTTVLGVKGVRYVDFNMHINHRYRKSVDYKYQLKKYLQENYGVELDNIVPCYLEKFTFLEFMYLLLDGHLKNVKKDIVEQCIKEIKALKEIDGCGVALFILSKFNYLITNPELDYFTSNYYDLYFLQEDLIRLVEFIGGVSINNEAKNDYLSSIKRSFYLNNEIPKYFKITEENASTRTLSFESYYDLILIALGEKLDKTYDYINSTVKEINDDDSEPFIADSINKISAYCRLQGFSC